jgi:hypothetical protein
MRPSTGLELVFYPYDTEHMFFCQVLQPRFRQKIGGDTSSARFWSSCLSTEDEVRSALDIQTMNNTMQHPSPAPVGQLIMGKGHHEKNTLVLSFVTVPSPPDPLSTYQLPSKLRNRMRKGGQKPRFK